MAQNIGEIVTILAIALIGIIFAVYLIILKKNGWLGGKSDFYRCPNQECKKIFQKPIELKDLSETPPRIYPACPECGADLALFFGSALKKVPILRKRTLIHQKKPKITSIEKKAEARRVEAPKQQQNKVSIFSQKFPIPKQLEDKKKAEATDSSCGYYFGYLASREKREQIPDKCLECPRTVDCMLYKSTKQKIQL